MDEYLCTYQRVFYIALIPLYTHRDSFNPVLLLRFAKDRYDKKCPFVH